MDRRWDKSKPPRGPVTLNRDCAAAQGLVLWWPVGAYGSKALFDGAGKNHPDTFTGLTPTLGTTGEPALDFANGSSSVIQSSTVPVYAPPLSLGMWFAKTTASDTTGSGLAAFGDYTLGSGSPRRFQFDTYNGDLRWLSVGASVGVATKSGIASKRWHHALGIEISSSSRYAVLDGVEGAQNTTSATPGGTQNRFVVGAIFDLGTNQGFFSGQIGEVCVWNRSVYEDRQALADPGRRFELWYPLRSRKWFSSGSPTYTSTLTESTTAADSLAAALTAVAAQAEAVTSADTLAAVLTAVAALAETTTVTDALAALLIAVAAVAEPATATELLSTGTQYSGTLTESASSADTLAAAATLVALLTEPATAADAQAAAYPATYNVTVAELATALEVLAAALGNEVFTAAARTRIGAPTLADALERIGSRTTVAGLVARVGGKRI